MKTLYSYCGKLGSGKAYCMMKSVEELKTTGNRVYLISFADPIKQILRDSFGLTKNGVTSKEFPEFSKIYVKHQICDSLYKILKRLKYEKFNISEHDLKAFIARRYEIYEDEFYSYVVGDGDDYSYNFRRLGQMLGTEIGRGLIDSIWIDTALSKVKEVFKQDLADYAFIDDLRFLNEFTCLEKFNDETAFQSIIYGVVASDETRGKRRGLTLDELRKQDSHGSEKDIDSIINKLDSKFVINNEE